MHIWSSAVSEPYVQAHHRISGLQEINRNPSSGNRTRGYLIKNQLLHFHANDFYPFRLKHFGSGDERISVRVIEATDACVRAGVCARRHGDVVTYRSHPLMLMPRRAASAIIPISACNAAETSMCSPCSKLLRGSPKQYSLCSFGTCRLKAESTT